MNTRTTPRTLSPLLAALVAALALGACSRQDDRTAGQKVDDAVARVEQKADEAKTDVDKAAADAKAAARDATEDARVAGGEARGDAAAAVRDATITTAVNAELAKDDVLRATVIDVDTSQGRVALRGSAPTAQAKERATQIAAAVDGVVSVDNMLEVKAES